MIDYHIDVDNTQVIKSLDNWERRLPNLHDLTLRRITARMVGNIQEYFLSGQALHAGTGRLRSSIMANKVDNYDYTVGSNVVYAKIHETGGVIHAKNVKNLAIPIDPMAYGKSPRSIPGLFFTMRGRKKFLALRPMFSRVAYQTKKGKTRFRNVANTTGAVRLMFVLKPSVTMPRRPYMSSGIDYTIFSGQGARIAEAAIVEHINKYWEAS